MLITFVNILTPIIPIVVLYYLLYKHYHANETAVSDGFRHEKILMIMRPVASSGPAGKALQKLYVLLICLIVIGEELTFRLWLVLTFESLTPSACVGILISAVAFGLLHLINVPNQRTSSLRWFRTLRFSATAFQGVIYGILAVWTGLMIFPILAHLGFNTIVLGSARMQNEYKKRKNVKANRTESTV